MVNNTKETILPFSVVNIKIQDAWELLCFYHCWHSICHNPKIESYLLWETRQNVQGELVSIDPHILVNVLNLEFCCDITITGAKLTHSPNCECVIFSFAVTFTLHYISSSQIHPFLSNSLFVSAMILTHTPCKF